MWKGWIVQTEGLSLSLGWGRALLFRCGNCDKSYYAVQTLFTTSIDQVSKLQEVLYVPRFYESNSKIHYIYPHPDVSEPIVIREPEVMPREAADFLPLPEYKIVAEFVRDTPFQHCSVLVGEWNSVSEEYYENRECNKCYTNELMHRASIRQGNLYLRKTDSPRIHSIHQPGVEKTAIVYNHKFIDATQPKNVTAIVRESSRGILGSLTAECPVIIVSPDHECIELEPGVWEFYHPRPREDID